MGLGDNLIATGMARGAKERGKRIAFGRYGGRTHWDKHSEEIFRYNPNIAAPGTEGKGDVEWINYRTGNRIYNQLEGRNWIWNYEFKVMPGEMYFNHKELAWAAGVGKGSIIIEPNVSAYKSWSINKDWLFARYQIVAIELKRKGYEIIQLVHKGSIRKLSSCRLIKTRDFRHALAALKNSSLYIGPEGGMHHGAAAVGIPAVVLFGGFIPPSVTGYDNHTNLTGGEKWWCGSLDPCLHCKMALDRIKVEEVVNASIIHLEMMQEKVA